MATHFARGILSTGEPLSTRLSAACHQSARLLPTYRQARFCASRSLLAELLFMLYGISELPEIINEANDYIQALNDQFTNPSGNGGENSQV